MFKSFTVMNDVGDSIVLGLGDPYKTGLLITNIDGLGPVKANVNTTNMSTRDGVYFNSARMNSRNIVLSIKLRSTDTETIEEVRIKSYKLFPVKKSVKIIVETDNSLVYSEGYVESNTPSIFSKSETTTISIICPDPYFYDLDETTTTFSGISAAFEFPYCIDMENTSYNLIQYPYSYDNNKGINPVPTFRITFRDGYLLCSGTTSYSGRVNYSKITLEPGQYALMNEINNDNSTLYTILTKQDSSQTTVAKTPTNGEGATLFTITENITLNVNLQYEANSTSKTSTLKPMVVKVNDDGTYPTEWQLYNLTPNKVEMGIVNSYTETNVYYDGDDTIGMVMIVNAIGPFDNLAIHNTQTRAYMKIDTAKIKSITGESIKAGDEIAISTVKGNKYITLLRDGVTTNILNCLSRDSTWLSLEKGDNLIAFTATEGLENINFKVYNEVLHEGV